MAIKHAAQAHNVLPPAINFACAIVQPGPGVQTQMRLLGMGARRTPSAHWQFYPPMPHPKKVQGTLVGPQPSGAQGAACTALPPHAANTLGGHPRMSNGLWVGWRSTWPVLILACHAAHLLGHHPQGRLFGVAGPPPPINCAFQVGWRSTESVYTYKNAPFY